MFKTFEEFLAARQPASDAIQHAARMLLAEDVDDLPVGKLREEVVRAADNPATVQELDQMLQRDPEARDAIAIAYLSGVWDSSGGPERVVSAVDDAEKSLPVIEIAIISTALMYIAYLQKTGSVESEETRVVTRKGGVTERITKRKLYGPTGPLAAIGSLIGKFHLPKK